MRGWCQNEDICFGITKGKTVTWYSTDMVNSKRTSGAVASWWRVLKAETKTCNGTASKQQPMNVMIIVLVFDWYCPIHGNGIGTVLVSVMILSYGPLKTLEQTLALAKEQWLVRHWPDCICIWLMMTTSVFYNWGNPSSYFVKPKEDMISML